MKYSTIQHENVNKDMLQPLLQQMFKIASHSMDTRPEMSSPFVSHFIDWLVYARPDCTWSFRYTCIKNHSKWSSFIITDTDFTN